MTTKCYFRILSESSTRECIKYQEMFDINFHKCLYECSGYKGFGECEDFSTDEDFKIGRKKLQDFMNIPKFDDRGMYQ